MLTQARQLAVEAEREDVVTSRVLLTVKEYAARERVTERTVRTWISKRAVRVRRTPGGGVRIVPEV